VAAPGDDSLRIVLTAGGASTAAQFEQVMKAVEADAANFPGVLRFSSQVFHPTDGRRFIVGYVHLGRPTITVQAAFAASEEPPQLRRVAASIRRSASLSGLHRDADP
jgi:hypothetical protein